MFGLIWRRLPGGTGLRLAVSLLLIAATAALMWHFVFPWLAPRIPFDQVTAG
jgi:hypothetical protein